MRGGPHLTRRAPDGEGPALPPLATGLALGLWIAAMLVLALVVVPALFGMCSGSGPA